MGFWDGVKSWTKKIAGTVAMPVVSLANATTSLFDGKKWTEKMDDYFEAVYDLEKPKSIDKREEPKNAYVTQATIRCGTPLTKEEVKAAKKELNKTIDQLKPLPLPEQKEQIAQISEKKWKEIEEFQQQGQKDIEQLKDGNTQLAAKMKEAQEKGDSAGVAKYRALIAQNQKEIHQITNQLKNLPQSKEEIQKQLTAIVAQSKQSLLSHINWGSWTTWMTVGGFLVGVAVIYYFVRKLWQKLKGENN